MAGSSSALSSLTTINVMLLIDDLCMGGAERQVVELALALDKERYNVTVVTLYPGQSLEANLIDAQGVELLSLSRKDRFDFSILGKLVKILRERDIHVLQPYLTPAAFFGLIAGIVAKTPVIVVTERSGLRDKSRLGDRTYRFLEDRLTMFADAAIANSKAGQRFLQSRGIARHKTDVVYNGVNDEHISINADEVKSVRVELGIPVENVVVGVAASLTPAKDHRNFLNAAAKVAAEMPDVCFLIVGEGPLRRKLEQQAACLGLRDRVVFAGQHANVAPYIANFDVAVLPSNNYEGCSNFLLEAMGIGTPCVATSVGGNPELIRDGENGLLVPPEDPYALANAIIRLIRDPDYAVDLARVAKAMVRDRFSLPRMVEEYSCRWEAMLMRHGVQLATRVERLPAPPAS